MSDPLSPLMAPTDILKFLIIGATAGMFFGLITGGYYFTLRIRKAQMRRLVITAFEQGVVDPGLVRERITYLHGHEPDFGYMFPASGSGVPEYYNRLGIPYGAVHIDWDAKRGVVNSRTGEAFQPLSARVRVSPVSLARPQLHPHLSSLRLEEQLALLFHASQCEKGRNRRKHGLGFRSEDLLADGQQDSELVLSVLILMPRPRLQLPERAVGDLAFGTTSYRWHFEVAEPASHMAAALSNENAILAPDREYHAFAEDRMRIAERTET